MSNKFILRSLQDLFIKINKCVHILKFEDTIWLHVHYLMLSSIQVGQL